MILSANYTTLGRPLGRSLGRAIHELLAPVEELIPDSGYVFVYTDENLQVFDNFNRAVQVPEEFATATIGSDDPANETEPNATAYVLMDGPLYNTPGVPSSGFVGGQSWRKMAPIGYFPYGNETYTYGDEVVRYETGVWLYENSNAGEIARAYSYAIYPWLATNWNNGFSAAKVTSTYVKTTNYPAVP
jgi:hypothetical protein